MCLWNKQTKPNQTQSKQTKHHLFCLFVQTVYRNQTKPNLLNNKFNIKCLKSKVPEKLARAAQLLYRSVLVFIKCSISGHVILFPFSGFHYLLPSAKCTQCCLYRQNVISANTERISPPLHSYYIA